MVIEQGPNIFECGKYRRSHHSDINAHIQHIIEGGLKFGSVITEPKAKFESKFGRN